MILSTEEMKAVEQSAFEAGVSAESLMDEAGLGIADTVREFFPNPGFCLVYYGKGNNGGDALVAAKHLAAMGWEIDLRSKHYDQQLSVLPRKKLREVKEKFQQPRPLAARVKRPFVILDGLLGIGASGGFRDSLDEAARRINESRRDRNAYVFAIDVPSGMNSDTGEGCEDCVVADVTIAIGFAKRGHLADGATHLVGRLVIVPLAALESRVESPVDSSEVATPTRLRGLLPRRAYDSHKTHFGRIAVIAGSRGYTGAPLMTCGGALRAGGGLVTLYARESVYSVLATSAPPEVMVQPVVSWLDVLEEKCDVIAIGPGLGREYDDEVLALIRDAKTPVVVDADALNALSENLPLLNECAGPRLLTPHPGEMARLQEIGETPRHEIVSRFVAEYPATLLLKGARTLIGESGQPLSYNTTGSPGMGTGGMGDILTGVCAALIGQGLSPYDAARLGAWTCGRAAELAVFSGECSEESLIATDLLARMGQAFQQLREGCY